MNESRLQRTMQQMRIQANTREGTEETTAQEKGVFNPSKHYVRVQGRSTIPTPIES